MLTCGAVLVSGLAPRWHRRHCCRLPGTARRRGPHHWFTPGCTHCACAPHICIIPGWPQLPPTAERHAAAAPPHNTRPCFACRCVFTHSSPWHVCPPSYHPATNKAPVTGASLQAVAASDAPVAGCCCQRQYHGTRCAARAQPSPKAADTAGVQLPY